MECEKVRVALLDGEGAEREPEGDAVDCVRGGCGGSSRRWDGDFNLVGGHPRVELG